jgi:hypothetical protein
VAIDAGEIAAAWRAAQELWGIRVELSPPEPLRPSGGQSWSADDPLAYIDLRARQVVVNLPRLEAIGARASLTAVLAHELGHHVRWPHTLGLAAQLDLLGRRLIPGAPPLTNLFFDLLVNEFVGRTHAAELAAVYRGEAAHAGPAPVTPLWWLYLAIYEELWGPAAGALVPAGSEDEMERAVPGCRAEARLFAQTFYALPDVYLQFVYFASVVIRYLGAAAERPLPMGADIPLPDVDDVAGAIYGNPQAERALDEARARGWIEAGREPGPPLDPLAAIDQLASGRPGNEQKAFRAALVGRHYKRLVERHLIRVPAVAPPPEPFLPTTLEEWHPGDDPRRIDWTASVLAAGPLAATRPLTRELEPEPPAEGQAGVASVEIYLDTSGSMPDPARALNAMTLAAQILAASAIRRGGKVRGVVFSTEALVSDWMADEETARRFLLQYAGGGTQFPFATLARLALERKDVIRVVISDGDFISNLNGTPGAKADLAGAAAATRRFVALLALARSWEQRVAAAIGAAPVRVVYVERLDRFAAVAADLARALWS